MKKRVFSIILIFAVLLSFPASAEEQEPEAVRLPIVMYHHISKDPARWNEYVVSADEFAADMDYLASHGWQSVSVRQLLDWYGGNFEMPEKPFMLTFDDGCDSTAAYAEPIVAAHGFTGVVAVIGSVCQRFAGIDEHEPEYSNLSWQDASEMAARGVIEVQCHTWDMHELYPRNGCARRRGESLYEYRRALSTDLSKYLQACEQYGVAAVPSIAFPYGAFSSDTIDVVRDMGFLAAFTCSEKINLLTGEPDELFLLSRFNRPHGVGSEKFFSNWEENT